jgi:hypothetical protein
MRLNIVLESPRAGTNKKFLTAIIFDLGRKFLCGFCLWFAPQAAW